MVDTPDKVRNTIKLFEENKEKEGIKTIIQEMMGENEERTKQFEDAQLFNDIELDTGFGVDQITVVEQLLEGD